MKNFIVLAFVIFAAAAHGQARVDVREMSQRSRICDGRRGGALTRRETQALRIEQQRIHRTERRARADGRVTVNERRRLDREQDRANRHIRRQKHDGQSRRLS